MSEHIYHCRWTRHSLSDVLRLFSDFSENSLDYDDVFDDTCLLADAVSGQVSLQRDNDVRR